MLQRRRLRVTGTVQGVGFRPFVYREAVSLGLAGYVRNDSAGVVIEVQGAPEGIAELCRRLVEAPPPLARVDGVDATPLAPAPDDGPFVILASDGEGPADVPVSVDTGTCDECLAEVADPANRRHDYPFTNCTNCGPRYTIVVSVPYDRAATTMAGFTMCPACQAEYDDPGDRRFDAQPNACPDCGPHLVLHGPLRPVARLGRGHRRHPIGRRQADYPAARQLRWPLAVAALRAGAILAIKGIGGYHPGRGRHVDAGCRRRASATQVPRRQALCRDGSRPGQCPAARRADRCRHGAAHLAPPSHRAGTEAATSGADGPRRGAGPGRARCHAALHAAASRAAGRGGPSRGHDQWQPVRRADRPYRR